MSITIDEATEERLVELLRTWAADRDVYLSAGHERGARRISSWLFGAELVLGVLGLDELAAAYAQTDSSA